MAFETRSYYINFTTDKTKVAANESSLVQYLKLDSVGAFFWNHVKNGGGDIIITNSDGSVQYPCEIVTCDTLEKKGEVWFKAPQSTSSDTVFRIYYGNSGASQPAPDSTYGSEKVYPSSYQLVQHMNEDPSGTPPEMKDSTSNDNDGTTNGSMVTGDLVAAKIGNGLIFDGNSQYVEHDLPSVFNDLANNDFTAKLWFKMPVHDTWKRLIEARYSDDYYFQIVSGGSDTKFIAIVNLLSTAIDIKMTSGVTENVLCQAVVTWEGDTDSLKFYIDGVKVIE